MRHRCVSSSSNKAVAVKRQHSRPVVSSTTCDVTGMSQLCDALKERIGGAFFYRGAFPC